MTSSQDQDLAPWAHPKAKAWFKALFNRSQFGFLLEDMVKQPADSISPELMRVMLAFAVLLGREETWPEEHRTVLNLILEKAREVANQSDSGGDKKAMTISQHRNRGRQNSEFYEEIEILRRRLGRSFKKSSLDTPATWKPFWT